MCNNKACDKKECTIEYGLCHCGCGQYTTLAKQTRSDRQWKKNEPKLYKQGHHARIQLSGKKKSEAHKKKMSDYAKNRTQEHKDNIHKSRIASGATLPIGATKLDTRGYIREKVSDGVWLAQHRLVIERNGYTLTDNDVVHHINGNRSDNRIVNLAVITKTHHSTIGLLVNALRSLPEELREMAMQTMTLQIMQQ